MSASENVTTNVQKVFPDIALLDRSKSFHSSTEGKVWVRMCINLCWWLHDMYEVDSNDLHAKLDYIEMKLRDCKSLFPARFVLMFSDPNCVPDEQHPFLICRQDEHKTILLVFRATVSTKSIQDVFTDLQFYSNCKAYEGDRHSGFAKRVESGPLLAVINWLQQGWKVIITGHSLGGAVSQLFTAEVIKFLVEIGLTIDQVVLRCITFGVPQCADHHFWSCYSAWYDVFDSYVYENDAIFRLVTFGTDQARNIIGAFVGYIGNIGRKIIEYTITDSLHIFRNAADQIGNIANDALIPMYTVFGRHHFIVKDHLAALGIISIGESHDEKEKLLNDLKNGMNPWYNYFIEKQLIPPGSFRFVYREFLNHGCYPFAINQLFNEEATRRLGHRDSPIQNLLRSPLGKTNSKSIFNLSAFIYSQNENSSYPHYIYLRGFLVDFIRFVKLPIELAESAQHREQKPVMTQEQSDGRAVLCFRSSQSMKFIKDHSTFFIEIITFFSSCFVQVAILSNVTNLIFPNVQDLDPVSTVLRAYHELVLDASSAEQYNDSPLSRCFSTFFDAFKLIDYDEGDKMLARYLAELQSSNYLNNIERYLEDLKIPESEDKIFQYFKEELISLKKVSEDGENIPDETRKTAEKRKTAEYLHQVLSNTLILDLYTIENRHLLEKLRTPLEIPITVQWLHKLFGDVLGIHKLFRALTSADRTKIQLTPLYLEFSKLRKYLRTLHNHREIDIIQNTLKSVAASFFFIRIKLNRLAVVFNNYGWLKQLLLEQYKTFECSYKSISPYHIYYPQFSNKMLTNRVTKQLVDISISLLLSINEEVNENEDEWQILMRLSGCCRLHEITRIKTEQERDLLWNRTFKNKPLKNVPNEHRWNWIGLIQLCLQLNVMREILIRKPPKVVISGRSQTGKSTLFKYLTGRNLKELRDINVFNTRMALQCPASIPFHNDQVNKDESGLVIDVVDNPGQDDATGQAKNLLDMTLHSASLFIVVTTLEDVNQQHNIELINKLLSDTKVKILILINKIDLRLIEEWEKSRNKTCNDDESEDEDWEQIGKSTISIANKSNSNFSALNTVKQLIERPKIEFKNGLTANQLEIDNRVEIRSIILKNVSATSTAYVAFQDFVKEENFSSEVSKSNVNEWIVRNLTKQTA